jgi:hypothetical protein
MTMGSNCEITDAPDTVEDEVGGVVPDAEAVAAAEAAIAALQANYPEWVRQDITRMEKALADARSDGANSRIHLRELFEICHNVKSQGGSFGYDLMTHIGQSLCDFLRGGNKGTEADLNVVQAHLTTMTTVVDNKIAGDGGEMGQRIVERLEAICANVLSR